MNLAKLNQKFQDWFTQQWVIWWGKQVSLSENNWLNGPILHSDENVLASIDRLAKEENLLIRNNEKDTGLIHSFQELNLSTAEVSKISNNIIDFYEHTSNYQLNFSVKWNFFFSFLGRLVSLIFSRRLNQLNIPTEKSKDSLQITNEIISLVDPVTNQTKYKVWLRRVASTNQIIYAGYYSTCQLTASRTCIKAVFPLPNGNSTVILHPVIGDEGELVLDSSGRRFGDAGFYFLVKDSKGKLWSRYHRSFRDQLVIKENDNNNGLVAAQTLTLWNFKVLQFQYIINRKF